MPPATAINLPEQFGRYRILKKIGQGGMGSVYLAEDTQLGRQVALKVPHFADKQDTLTERFQREARLAASINHTNLCPVFDVGEVNGTYYFTMPYIEGTQLSERAGRPWPIFDAVELVRKLALAVDVMHRKGIIHRDLKPSNVLLQENEEPILMDFGLAKCLTSDSDRLTVMGTAMGTPAYMSPEQAIGDPANIGTPTDVYSLGIILYQLVTGQQPFEGPPLAIYAQLMKGDFMPPKTANRDVDAVLNDIILKAMARTPQDRYPTMSAFAGALVAYVRQRDPARAPVNPRASTGQSANAPGRVATGATSVDHVRLECRQCGQGALAPAMALGKRMLCPRCRSELVAPSTPPPPPLVAVETTPEAKKKERTLVSEPSEAPVERKVSEKTKWWILGAVGVVLMG